MWIVVLIGIALVVLFWQYILAGLALWASLSIVRALINLAAADPKPTYPRTPLQTRPVAKPVQARPVAKRVQTGPVAKPRPKPEAARELPAPDYLPRWNPDRRQDVGRQLAQWQKDFDSAAQ